MADFEKTPLQAKDMFEDEITQRRNFIQRVYSILLVMLGITIGISALFRARTDISDWVDDHATLLLVLSLVLSFTMIFVIICIEPARKSFPMNFVFLFLFNLGMSIMVGLATVHYSTDIVLMAFGTTAFITICLTLFAFQTTIDFTGLGPYLFCFLMGLIFMGILNIFIHDQVLHTLYSALGAIIFSMYIVYDTQIMLGGNHKYAIEMDEYVMAAMSLYLDIINLFLYLLDLFNRG